MYGQCRESEVPHGDSEFLCGVENHHDAHFFVYVRTGPRYYNLTLGQINISCEDAGATSIAWCSMWLYHSSAQASPHHPPHSYSSLAPTKVAESQDLCA